MGNNKSAVIYTHTHTDKEFLCYSQKWARVCFKDKMLNEDRSEGSVFNS